MSIPGLLTLIFLVGFASGQPRLSPDEEDSIMAIAMTLVKLDWPPNPCNRPLNWLTPDPLLEKSEDVVTCDCTFANNTICHVVGIVLKSQNLTGSVPRELIKLPFLQVIDLGRNYLSGTIPPEWGSMKLVHISLLGNRVTGSLPKELANISTLSSLVLEYNQLTGSIPQEFGDLPRIKRLLLTSNYLTRELPEHLAKMTTLIDFRIGDNNFQGSIPNFIGNWTNITKLVIQGSGLSGPIPSSIASLTKLTDLRISDLNGSESTFPPLSNMMNMKTLILRSCNIVGELPSYIGAMTTLEVFDLSFNKLTGRIPDSFVALSNTKNIYLTGNSLSGPLPPWMLKDGKNIDLSYNNLTLESSAKNCPPHNLNLFASSKGNSSGIVSCLRSFQCPQRYCSLHINCGGGPEVDDKRTPYEEDTDPGGPSNFYQSNSNWGLSSTGHFLDDDHPHDSFILSNPSSISGPNSQLYTTARLSPLSLTYYGFCLYLYTTQFYPQKFEGSLKEHGKICSKGISSLKFGNLVQKDFNIEKEAGGINKEITRNFTAVVTDNTLDIRFYWAGKGTNGIPYKGVYGPLISAISVDSNFTPPSENGNSISTGAIVGIVVAVLFAILLVLAILWWNGCLRRKDTIQRDLKGLDLHVGSFTLRQIKAATNNFDPANKIGEGGFGPVYKGFLLDGTIIAVKQLSSRSKQGIREFVNEIGMISALQHPHLVKLYGCCIEGDQLLLIYEYLENNSLARALFGPEEHQLHLDWRMRHKICIGIARGLAYLHEESRLKIVHRDIKATNVLLDKNLVPKISDFGIAKLDEEDNTHISTRIAGTLGYMAPEYAMKGHLTDKADVYSFGVVLLEVISGRSNITIKAKACSFCLLDWSNFNRKEVMTTINVALLCTNAVAAERPSMSAVVSILEGKSGIQGFVSESVSIEKMNPKETMIESQSMSMDVSLTSSSTSAADLYPITLDTDYWEKRDQSRQLL
ncbi:Serine/threonine protein kinase [Handroanthus impetiginosus]|uniref:non-specific serine/threonine protein kinase n=1 Tax=Handroanthus impetiginosus TaxID=429701 RepID=A0A2G9GH80_9LAMI|nr:Serine/threonine protein kinase [Handroanthus impetiginosus]